MNDWSVLSDNQWASLQVDPLGIGFNVTYTYDPAGNRIGRDDGTTVTTYTYSNANRLELADASGSLTTYTNDAAGNRTSEVSATDSTYYGWDAVGRMSTAEPAAGTVTLTYNADGQRTAKQSTDGSTTGFLYDHKHLLSETDDVGGDITNTYATTTDLEYGDLISEDGEGYTYQFDAMANTNALLDPAGNVQAQFKYDAWGQVNAVSIDGDAWASLSASQWATMGGRHHAHSNTAKVAGNATQENCYPISSKLPGFAS